MVLAQKETPNQIQRASITQASNVQLEQLRNERLTAEAFMLILIVSQIGPNQHFNTNSSNRINYRPSTIAST